MSVSIEDLIVGVAPLIILFVGVALYVWWYNRWYHSAGGPRENQRRKVEALERIANALEKRG